MVREKLLSVNFRPKRGTLRGRAVPAPGSSAVSSHPVPKETQSPGPADSKQPSTRAMVEGWGVARLSVSTRN